ncbi:MAG: VWA domain-containing protein [Bryobacterales bacterium]|nr:VWA domain-containing protein [Bryobacterales bacterium]
MRTLLAGLAALGLFAQQEDVPGQVFRATVNIVEAPVTVTDREGNFVSGLDPSAFRLYDNETAQDVKVDVTYIPISLVVAVQANWDMEKVLPKLQKIGSLFQGLVTGEQGEVAVLCYDHRVQVLQDFTTDADLISKAFTKLKQGSTSNAMIDAAMEGARMLGRRPGNRRRILLLIGETRDRGSENRARDALLQQQFNNILTYTVNVNRLVTTLTAKPQPPRPDPYPAGARPLPPNVAPTPEATRSMSVAGAANSASLLPVIIEVFKQVKAIFVDNPAELFTEYTGGREYAFISQRDLERAVSDIGQELHSQYLLTYNPNNKMEAGWHDIRVEVLDRTGRPRRDVKVRARPGYWMAAVPAGARN